MGTVTKSVAATVRSTAFISAFVGLYMGAVCTHRNLVGRDHRAVYYAAGVVAASALFIEKKSRRAELALYLMPRAVDSLVATMAGRPHPSPQHVHPEVEGAQPGNPTIAFDCRV